MKRMSDPLPSPKTPVREFDQARYRWPLRAAKAGWVTRRATRTKRGRPFCPPPASGPAWMVKRGLLNDPQSFGVPADTIGRSVGSLLGAPGALNVANEKVW